MLLIFSLVIRGQDRLIKMSSSGGAGAGAGGGGGSAGGVGGSGEPNMSPFNASYQSHQSSRSEPTNQRFSSLIHDSEVFLTKLREFKPQSLGCLEARRKSSSTLIFPSPQQACVGAVKCSRYPHNVKPTPGYWIECHGAGPFASSKAAASCSAPATQDEPGTKTTATSGRDAKSSSSTTHHHHHYATTPTSDRILTRHDRDLDMDLDPVGDTRFSTTLANKQELLQQRRQSTSTEGHQLSLSSSELQTSGQDLPPGLNNEPSDMEPISQHQMIEQHKNPDQAAEAANKLTQSTTTTTTKQQPPAATSSSGRRRKLNKRTMTRDDIDLHKTRRGTPNITITEPSFNQSTIAYQPSLRQHYKGPPSRQDSQAGDSSSRNDSTETSPKPQPPAISSKPIKFHIQRFMSSENDQDQPSFSRRLDSIERQESSESELDFVGGGDGGGGCSGGFELSSIANKYESYRPQHRPSIIREDVDNECAASEQISQQQQQQHQYQQPQHHALNEQKDFYCGLSTTTFTKKSYQQAHLEQADVDQFKDGSLELISFEEENYEKHYYGREHWNYFTNDELLGPVMLSLKQEVNNQRDHFHVLLRTVSYTLHGTIPASTICADRYDREAIVRELSEIAKLKPPLMLGQLPSTPDELLKLDHIFIKTELKVGVIYIKTGQAESEEGILGNKEESPLFAEFLDLLGDRITLKGFDRYKGGLDTVHNLTGTESVYTMWRNIEIMFHVSTMLPHEENDPQKLQKKRHIGNDIVCVAFIESDDTLFWPGCIKSYFLHTFIAVTTSPKALREGEKRKYSVSCVCRNEVQYAFRPYLIEQDEFFKSDYFREWLLVKIVNGERASYSAPKFARMQDRTRSQLLEDITTSLANHLVTGQIPKPYRRGSWRPLGHTRASSPLEDSMKDYFEDYDHLARDFCLAFCGPSRSMLCDVVFRVKDSDGTFRLVHGVRAIMAIRSRTFLEMLYGFVPPGTGPSSIQNQTNLRAIEMKVLAGDLYTGSSGKELEQTKSLLAKRGSVGADSSKKTGDKERRQSMLPNLSKSLSQKPNYLTVPNTSGGGGGSGGSGGGGGANTGGGTGGMIKSAFNRLVSGNWSGWSGNIKGYKGEPMHIKVDQNKTKVDFNSLAICKEIAKIDSDKLAQREFEIKEFDYETFQQTIEYIHNGQCKLSYETIPGLICAAEHYDLPDLLHSCFHHANTHMKLSAAPKMMNALYQSSCFYITAMQLLESIYEYIDPNGNEFFLRTEYLELYESVFTSLLLRKTLQISELRKFQAMHEWAKQQVANKIRQKRQQQQLQQQQQLDDQEMELIETDTLDQQLSTEEAELEYRNLMNRLNKEVNIKLDKISNEDLVKVVLPTKVFGNDKIFEVMADESRNDY